MLRNQFLVTAFSLALAGAVPGAALAGPAGESPDTPSYSKEEVEQAVRDFNDMSEDKRDKAVSSAKRMLDTLDGEIEDLQAKMSDQWDDMTAQERDVSREAMESLHKQRAKLAEWYGGLKHGAKESWSDVKQGFSDAFTEVKGLWQDTKDRFDGS